MAEQQAISATFAEVEVLKSLWELEYDGKPAAYLSEIRERICARRRQLGLPEPALTTVSTNLRNGVAKGIFREMQYADGEPVPLVRSGVRSSLASSRAAQKVAYSATLRPTDVLPQMLRELASLYPESMRVQAVVALATELGFSKESLQKLESILKKA